MQLRVVAIVDCRRRRPSPSSAVIVVDRRRLSSVVANRCWPSSVVANRHRRRRSLSSPPSIAAIAVITAVIDRHRRRRRHRHRQPLATDCRSPLVVGRHYCQPSSVATATVNRQPLPVARRWSLAATTASHRWSPLPPVAVGHWSSQSSTTVGRRSCRPSSVIGRRPLPSSNRRPLAIGPSTVGHRPIDSWPVGPSIVGLSATFVRLSDRQSSLVAEPSATIVDRRIVDRRQTIGHRQPLPVVDVFATRQCLYRRQQIESIKENK